MRVKAFDSLPLKRYPVNGEKFRIELEGYLSGLAESGSLYLGYLEKSFNKLCYRCAIFKDVGVPFQCQVLRSSEAEVVNYPASESSLEKSANPVFERLGQDDWLFSGSFPKSVGANKEVYWVFYRKANPR